MDWKVIEREWPALIPAIMDRWPEAEEDDLLQLDGTRDALAGYLSARTEGDYEDVLEQIAEWRMGGIPADVRFNEINDNVNITASGRHVPEGEDVYDDDRAFGDDQEAAPPVGRT